MIRSSSRCSWAVCRRSEQKLDRAQVPGTTIDQGRLRAAEGVSPEDVPVQSDARNPFPDKTRVLPCRHGLAGPPTACEQKLAGLFARRLEIVINRLAGLLRQFEPDGTPGLEHVSIPRAVRAYCRSHASRDPDE